MRKSSNILCLLLVALLLISSGSQAMLMSNMQAGQSAAMSMDDNMMHCEDGSGSSTSCQHDHCSMCMIGMLGQGLALFSPSPSPSHIAPPLTSPHFQASLLYRPPKR